MDYLLLVIGFILLIKGADYFVEGSSKLAAKIGIPSLIVGLVVVSIGTSLPELGISVTSSIQGKNDMAVGNIIGSNIFNILIVLGAAAAVSPIVINKKQIKKDYLVTYCASVLFLILTFTGLLGGGSLHLTRIDGILLIACCIFYVLYLGKSINSDKNKNTEGKLEEAEDSENIKVLPNLIKFFVGITAIGFGSSIVVRSASNIGISYGMSEQLVGLTIASIGSSLPELVTSVVASRKGENEIALGNALGSCIFNILLIIGVSSILSPITVDASLIVDFLFDIFILTVLGIIVFHNTKKETKILKRAEGIFLILLYIGYFSYIIIRN